MSLIDILDPPKEPTPDERIYNFWMRFEREDTTPEQLYPSFHGRIDDNHFVPQPYRETHTITGFNFHPFYVHLDLAFGGEFRTSFDDFVRCHLQPWMNEAIENMPIGKERTLKNGSMEFSTKDFPETTILTGNMQGFDSRRIFFGVDEESVEALRQTKDFGKARVDFGVNEIGDLFGMVYVGDENYSLMDFTLASRSEIAKPDRPYPGYEFRYYEISGRENHLGQLEKGLAFMEELGEVGHSSGLAIRYDEEDAERISARRLSSRPNEETSSDNARVYRVYGTTEQLDELEKAFGSLGNLSKNGNILIGYDGDGNARMSFQRFDGKPLTFPQELLTYHTGEYHGDPNGLEIEFNRFKEIVQGGSDTPEVYYDYRDEDGQAYLVLGKNTESEGRFEEENREKEFVID